MPIQDLRLEELTSWVSATLGGAPAAIEVASADASFRRYFRAHLSSGDSLIVMDAPPEKEDITAFLAVASLLDSAEVHVPKIHAENVVRGFILLEDLGSTPYLDLLRQDHAVDPLYRAALDTLLVMQTRARQGALALPVYDAAVLQREMALFPEWFCARHLGYELTDEEQDMLRRSFDFLVSAALAQPCSFVHRDYHSRNLMVLGQPGGEVREPGVLDFQDALWGPVTYDLVSLLKDCYICWPRARVEAWVRDYRQRLLHSDFAEGAGQSDAEFLRWFDLLGMQRHIKVLGIFARLWWRDGKPGYLDDLPLTLAYLRQSAHGCPQLKEFGDWLERIVAPQLDAARARALATPPAGMTA